MWAEVMASSTLPPVVQHLESGTMFQEPLSIWRVWRGFDRRIETAARVSSYKVRLQAKVKTMPVPYCPFRMREAAAFFLELYIK